MLNLLRIMRREVVSGKNTKIIVPHRKVEAEKIIVFSSQCTRERKAEMGDDKRWPERKGRMQVTDIDSLAIVYLFWPQRQSQPGLLFHILSSVNSLRFPYSVSRWAVVGKGEACSSFQIWQLPGSGERTMQPAPHRMRGLPDNMEEATLIENRAKQSIPCVSAVCPQMFWEGGNRTEVLQNYLLSESQFHSPRAAVERWEYGSHVWIPPPNWVQLFVLQTKEA